MINDNDNDDWWMIIKLMNLIEKHVQFGQIRSIDQRQKTQDKTPKFYLDPH